MPARKALATISTGDSQEMDSDGARKTTLTFVKIVPTGYEADQTHSLIIASKDSRGLPVDMLTLATFLYENEAKTGPLPEIPAKFTEDE
jgi:hypothetical protein